MNMHKFRAWDTAENEWVDYPVYIDSEGDVFWEHYEMGLQTTNSIKIMYYTDIPDTDGITVCEGDYIEASRGTWIDGRYYPLDIYQGVVKFGEYVQDASGGEHGGTRCKGFYLESELRANSDKEFEWDYDKTQSLLGFNTITITGNIYGK